MIWNSGVRPGRRVENLVIVGLSARQLARSASRSGCFRIYTVDGFADKDTSALSLSSKAIPWLDGQFKGAVLLETIDDWNLDPDFTAVIYGSGFEATPEVLMRIAERFTVYGNSPEVLMNLMRPEFFWNQLQQLGIPYPEVSFVKPREAVWLVKKTTSSGGTGVELYSGQDCDRRNGYYQRFAKGDVLSCLFLANGLHARIVGFGRQFFRQGKNGATPFVFAGVESLSVSNDGWGTEVTGYIQAMVRKFGLRGLNGIDFIVTETGQVLILELNLRPTASIELYDDCLAAGLVQAHIDAIDSGVLAYVYQQFAQTQKRGYWVFWAAESYSLPADLVWPSWCSDLPASTQILKDQPVCTIQVRENAAEFEQVRLSRVRQLQEILSPWAKELN